MHSHAYTCTHVHLGDFTCIHMHSPLLTSLQLQIQFENDCLSNAMSFVSVSQRPWVLSLSLTLKALSSRAYSSVELSQSYILSTFIENQLS